LRRLIGDAASPLAFDDLIITTAGGTGPRVQGLNGTNLHALLNFNAYDPTFLGGVFVG